MYFIADEIPGGVLCQGRILIQRTGGKQIKGVHKVLVAGVLFSQQGLIKHDGREMWEIQTILRPDKKFQGGLMGLEGTTIGQALLQDWANQDNWGKMIYERDG